MNTNEIKKHFPALYDILVQRANKVVELKLRCDGINPDKALLFLSDDLKSMDSLMCWRDTPEGYEFWQRLDNSSYSEVKDMVRYKKYKTSPVKVHDLWI